jgi:hypothetical protein
MNYLRLATLILLAFSFFIPAQAISDNSFDRFIKPLSNPVYLDDPRNETYVHIVHVLQNLPSRVHTELGSLPLNGRLNLTALRITYAINERFSLIAGKDGYIDFDPDSTLKNASGWGDIQAGAKYAIIHDPDDEFILSGKLMFEFSQGSREVFQGNGDGHISPSLSFLKGIDKLQLVGTLGGILPFNHNQESTLLYNAWHASYALTEKFRPLVEVNHFAVMREGNRDELVASIAKFEGGDVINLGSQSGKKHRHFVSMAWGFRYRCMDYMDMGIAYEYPLSGKHNGLMDNRTTFDLVFHF